MSVYAYIADVDAESARSWRLRRKGGTIGIPCGWPLGASTSGWTCVTISVPSALVGNPELAAEAATEQLGHTDGGALAMWRYGDLDDCLRLSRVAVAARGATNVPSLRMQRPSMGPS